MKTKIKKLCSSNLILAVGINVFFFLSILIFCDIKYEVSDDFIMAAIMSGAFGNEPNPHLMFINIIWGYFMLPFYHFFPGISWYLIFQLLLCVVSFTMVTYMLLVKLDKLTAMMLSGLMITFFADDAYILVQFTKTAMIAVMGGGIVFAWALFEKKEVWIKMVSASICLAGTLIRFEVIYIAGGFLLFILGVEIFECIFVKKDKKYVEFICGIVIPGIFVVILAFGMKWFDGFIYNQSPEYKYFREYSSVRSAIVDTAPKEYQVYESELQKIGISENDFNLMKTWNFADNKVFSLDVMKKVGDIIAENKKCTPVSKEKIFEEIQNRGLSGYPIFLSCVVVMILTIVFQKKKYFTAFIVFGIGWLYIIYFFVRGRVLYRLEYAVFLGVLLSMFYFWEKFTEKSEEIIKNKTRICIIIISLTLFLESILYLPDRSYLLPENSNRKSYIENTFLKSWNYDARKYRKIVNIDSVSNDLLNEIKSNKDNFYFLEFNTTIQSLYFEWNPFLALPSNYFDNFTYMSGITTNFPDWLKNIEEHHVEQPLKNLVEDNVYLIDIESRVYQKIVFLQEHYYPEARMEFYKDLDGYQVWKIYKH